MISFGGALLMQISPAEHCGHNNVRCAQAGFMLKLAFHSPKEFDMSVGNKHPHYHKDVSNLQTVDVYRVLALFNLTGIDTKGNQSYEH